jgi:hypothetical protein
MKAPIPRKGKADATDAQLSEHAVDARCGKPKDLLGCIRPR